MSAVISDSAGRLANDLRWGVRGGVAFAVVYSIIAAVIFLMRGDAAFQSYRISLGGIVMAYIAGGCIGGATVGALRPLLRWQVGAMLVAVMGVMPLFFAINILRFGWFSVWTAGETVKCRSVCRIGLRVS